MWEAKIECRVEVKFDGSRLSEMTVTGIGVLMEESMSGREMESIGDTSVSRRRAPAGVGEGVKEGDGVRDVSMLRRRGVSGRNRRAHHGEHVDNESGEHWGCERVKGEEQSSSRSRRAHQ